MSTINKKYISLGFKVRRHSDKTKKHLSKLCRSIALKLKYGQWMKEESIKGPLLLK